MWLCYSVFIGAVADSGWSVMLTEVLLRYLTLVYSWSLISALIYICSSENSETQTIKATTKKSCVGEYPKCPEITHLFNIRPTIKSGESYWSILMTWSRHQFILPSPSPAKDSGGELDLRRTGLGEAPSWGHGKAQRHRICSDPVWGAAAMRPDLSFPLLFSFFFLCF